MLKIIKAFILLVLFLPQCTSQSEKFGNKEICEEYTEKSAEYFSQFYFNQDTANLDSSIYYIDQAIGNCSRYQGVLSLRKLSILSIKQDYLEALEIIDNLENEMYSDLPYFQSFLKNRFIAMKAQAEGNFEKRNLYIKLIIEDIETFLSKNDDEIASLLISESDSIFESPLSTAIIQYYYYRSILVGDEQIETELIRKQEANKINNNFYDYMIAYLEEDFMIFSGI